ncbi:MAG: tripartite tricarboxylate transporter substrate binding protein [Alphaproteobacteria bacterium]|nr:tripartite tricarboxylate transporter substrate binding protein [Alphaproteobacteria bacterium]
MFRRTLVLSAMALSLAAAPAIAEPAKVMIPGGAGGGWDGTGRLAFEVMQKAGIFTEGATITNKGGAAGTLGLADFMRTKGQDSSVMVMGVIMVGGIIANKSPVNLDTVTPLARLTFEWNAIAVPADSPIKNAKDFMEALKKDPGAMSVAGGSAGGVDHATLALLAKIAGVPADKLNYVPFNSGAEVVTSVAGGKVKAAISGISELKPQVDTKRIRFVAVTSEKGSDGTPSLKEQGIDLSIGNWRGIVGAPEMSAAGRKAWLDRLEKMSKTKEWKEGLEKAGLEDAILLGDAYGAFLNEEKARWATVLKEVGIAK